MEIAEIIGIDEEDLHGFMRVFPNMWEHEKPLFSPEITLVVNKYGETEEFIFGVYIYTLGSCVLAMFLEYQREFATAIFEIHGFCFDSYGMKRDFQFGENRVKDIILRNAGKDYKLFSTIPLGGIFTCPKCRAQYTLRSLRVSPEGKVYCQNCGRLVKFSKEEEESENSD